MQNSFCAREEKEHEGEDFYRSHVPTPYVENVWTVEPTISFYALTPAVSGYISVESTRIKNLCKNNFGYTDCLWTSMVKP